MKTHLSRKAWTVVLAVGIVAGVSATAWAWQESNPHARMTTSGDDICLTHWTNVTHSGSTGQFKVRARAAAKGFEPATPSLCQPATGYAGWIKGTMSTYILKLEKEGSGSNRDEYSVCKLKVESTTSYVFNFDKTYVWSSPPCGPGHYAVVSGIAVDGLLWDLGTDVHQGSFQPSDDFDGTWNISHHWHPALDGDEVFGPEVKL